MKPLRRSWRLSVANGKQVTVFNRRHQVSVLRWSLSSCTTDSREFAISIWKNFNFFLNKWDQTGITTVRSTEILLFEAQCSVYRPTVFPILLSTWLEQQLFLSTALTGEMRRVSHETGTKFESIIHKKLHTSERQQMFLCLCPLQVTQIDQRQRNRTLFECNTANRVPRNGFCLILILYYCL